MELAGTDMKSLGASTGPAGRWSDTAFSTIRTLRDRWLNLRSQRALDRLDDRLLRDIGLRRERFPSGAARVAPL
jgi:uncharacterized protein YjiS (DUF1127 family)